MQSPTCSVRLCISFYNTSPFDMKKLMGDLDRLRENLSADIQALSLNDLG
jgi:hypothetical protein